jgi:hypothetical protein
MVVNDEMEGIWKKVVMTNFKVLSQYLPGWTEENYRNPQSGCLRETGTENV